MNKNFAKFVAIGMAILMAGSVLSAAIVAFL